jgi:hypothetical protein
MEMKKKKKRFIGWRPSSRDRIAGVFISFYFVPRLIYTMKRTANSSVESVQSAKKVKVEEDAAKVEDASGSAKSAALVQINTEFVAAKAGARDFSFSVAEKKKFIAIFGVETLSKIIIEHVRRHEMGVINGEVVAERLTPLVERVKTELEKLEKKGSPWTYTVGKAKKKIIHEEADTILLRPTASGGMLSTALSGCERYAQRMVVKKPTPLENWQSDAILKKAVVYLCTNATKLETEALSRGRLRVFCMQGQGCQHPSAFPISVVMWILKREAALRPTGVLSRYVDPCAGWGDRLAASLLVGKSVCQEYVGIDPWHVSNETCAKIYTALRSDSTCTATILKQGAEDQTLPWPEAELCFTSPPYGALECYNIDAKDPSDQQAWKMVANGKFISGFIAPLMLNAAKCTKRLNGRVIINIGNVLTDKNGCADLTERVVQKAKEAGMVLVETFGMSLSVRATPTTSKHGDQCFRGEPFFVFAHSQQ